LLKRRKAIAAVKALSGNLRYFQHSTQSLVEFSSSRSPRSPPIFPWVFRSFAPIRHQSRHLGAVAVVPENCSNVACQLTSALFIVMSHYNYADADADAPAHSGRQFDIAR